MEPESAEERLRRVKDILEDGALEDMRVGADELATCTNEQKLAQRLRYHAENLREAVGLPEADREAEGLA